MGYRLSCCRSGNGVLPFTTEKGGSQDEVSAMTDESTEEHEALWEAQTEEEV